MDTKLIARLIELVRKTGDRVVIPDDMENGRAVVIMDLDAYEELMGTASKESRIENATAELPLRQSFAPEPVMPEPDVVQQIRAIRGEPAERDSATARQRDSQTDSVAPPANLPTSGLQDLTPPKNDAKIKREIGDWKTVGEVRPSVPSVKSGTPFGQAKQPLNQPAVQPVQAAADQLEDEERFYLEPIE